MTAFLEIQGLRVKRDRRLVLSIDHLLINPASVTALVGPNGAGKSTLLLVLAGLLRPQEGRIWLNGKQVEPYFDRSYRRKMTLVMQEPFLLDMSVFENVAMGLRFRRVRGRELSSRVEQWLESFGLGSLRDRPACKLSGGEAQRVALARALVLQPELLLLDEPFNSLDKDARAGLLRDLKALLPATHATTLFSTHDEREVELLAEATIELSEGKPIRMKGNPGAVMARPDT
jgi:tungstate transport system ATP-binding protein